MKQKILLLSATIFAFSLMTSAQSITKGSTMLGWNISQGITKAANDSFQTRSGFFGISAGKAIKENSILGISLGYYPLYSKSLGSVYITEERAKSYSFSVFYRKYYNLSQKLYLFGQGALGYTHFSTKQKSYNGNSEHTTQNIGINLMPGFSYRVLKSLYLDLTMPNILNINYGSNKGTISKQKSFTFSSSLSSGTLNNLGVGFNFIF